MVVTVGPSVAMPPSRDRVVLTLAVEEVVELGVLGWEVVPSVSAASVVAERSKRDSSAGLVPVV